MQAITIKTVKDTVEDKTGKENINDFPSILEIYQYIFGEYLCVRH